MIPDSDLFRPEDEIEKHFFISIWRVRDNASYQREETILPKGTAEIIFNLSTDPIAYVKPASSALYKLPCCFINGINTQPFHLIKSGQQLFIGIQMTSLGLKSLFGIDACDFNNNVVEAALISRSLHALCDELYCQHSFSEQVAIIRKWLRLQILVSGNCKTLFLFQKMFQTSNIEAITINNLCRAIGVSDRQLRRLSTAWLGMNTEKFFRYHKYLSALHLLHQSHESLTQIGLRAGYYDQSHFIREFKCYTGLTPKEYRLANTGLPGHLFS